MDYTWCRQDATSFPEHAVFAGYQSDGAVAYVGRVIYHGRSLPANVIPSKNRAYTCYNGREIYDSQYELLIRSNYAWAPYAGDKLPPNCVLFEDTSTGEKVPVGRGHWIRSLVVGRIDTSELCLRIPFGGIEHRLDTFEVLIRLDSEEVQRQEKQVPETNVEEKGALSRWTPCTKQSSKAVLVSDNLWVKSSSYASIPADAVVCGHNPNGEITYVGRAYHEGLKRPAKVVPSTKCAFIPWGHQEVQKSNYEVLTGNHFKWLPGSNGDVPPNAVVVGLRNEEENYYIGRAVWTGGLCFGEVIPSTKKLSMPLNGSTYAADLYEVLCYSLTQDGMQGRCSHLITWEDSSGSSIPENAFQVVDDAGIYVGNAYHDGELHPAMVVPSKGLAYLTYGGKKWEKPKFNVLIGDAYCWVPDEGGRVPACAVQGGETGKNEPLYIGRTLYSGAMTMGKVQQSTGCMFIAVDDNEVCVKHYEVLVHGEPWP